MVPLGYLIWCLGLVLALGVICSPLNFLLGGCALKGGGLGELVKLLVLDFLCP